MPSVYQSTNSDVHGGSYISLQACFVHDLVDVISRYPRLDGGRSYVEDFSRYSAHFPHAILFRLVEYCDVATA